MITSTKLCFKRNLVNIEQDWLHSQLKKKKKRPTFFLYLDSHGWWSPGTYMINDKIFITAGKSINNQQNILEQNHDSYVS